MKTTTVENTTDAAIYLPLMRGKDDPDTVMVPRAVKQKVRDEKTGDDHVATTNGSKQVDSDQLAQLRENNKVVAGYFANGRLKEVGSGPHPSTQVSKGK